MADLTCPETGRHLWALPRDLKPGDIVTDDQQLTVWVVTEEAPQTAHSACVVDLEDGECGELAPEVEVRLVEYIELSRED